MEGNIRTLKTISTIINKIIVSHNDSCVERHRKNDAVDAILYKLYYTKCNSTQEKATIKLYELENVFTHVLYRIYVFLFGFDCACLLNKIN